MNIFTKQKQAHRHRGEKKLMVTKGEKQGEDKLGIWDQQIHITIYKIHEQPDLLYSTGTYILKSSIIQI